MASGTNRILTKMLERLFAALVNGPSLNCRPHSSRQRVDWTLFFDAPHAATAQRAKKIDGRLPGYLIRLPSAITGETEIEEYHSLAVRDLERGHGVGLPSGEAVARHLGVAPLTSDEVGLRARGWAGETPLWYYILREAAASSSGDRLGTVGGRIVTEVIVTLLDRDPTSVRFADADWKPRRSLLDLLRTGA